MSADYWRKWPVPFTFTVAGDEAAGIIVGLGDLSATWPELHIRDGDGLVRVVRVTQRRLHEQLGELQPGIGDKIRIRYTGDTGSPAGRIKEFAVKVWPKDSQPRPGTEAGTNGGKAAENAAGAEI